MVLKITLKPYERFIVNGCALRNSARRHTIVIEEQADVVRGNDLLEATSMATPVGKAYFMIQTALTRADVREKLVPMIQKHLAELATALHQDYVPNVFDAANHVSCQDYYKALRALRPVLKYEEELFSEFGGNTEQIEESEDAEPPRKFG